MQRNLNLSVAGLLRNQGTFVKYPREYFAERTILRSKDFRALYEHFVKVGLHQVVPEFEILCEELCRFIPLMSANEFTEILNITRRHSFAPMGLLESVYKSMASDSAKFSPAALLNCAFLGLDKADFFVRERTRLDPMLQQAARTALVSGQNRETTILSTLSLGFSRVLDKELGNAIGSLVVTSDTNVRHGMALCKYATIIGGGKYTVPEPYRQYVMTEGLQAASLDQGLKTVLTILKSSSSYAI